MPNFVSRNPLRMKLATQLTAFLGGPVFAHTGHNNSHWSADLLHYGFYISLATMIAIVMYCMVRLLTSDREQH